MKYVIAILFYASVGVALGSFIGWNLINVDSEIVLGAVAVGSVVLVSFSLYLIARQTFPYLKGHLIVIILSIAASMGASGYAVMINKHMILLLIFITVPSAIFLACVLVLMVVFGVESNKKEAQIAVQQVISVPEPEKARKGPGKKPNPATLLRGVNEIHEYSTGGKKKAEEDEE
jgi:hypothetical protein